MMSRAFQLTGIMAGCCLAMGSMVGCGSGQALAAADQHGELVSADEPLGVLFKPGRPAAGEGLEESLAEPQAFYFDVLQRNTQILAKYRGAVFRVIGNADSRECVGEECRALSLRRAEVVDRWLRLHGVPADSLAPPVGFGAERPRSDNDSDEGRSNNRNAFLELEKIGSD
jgi:hypothetical protein